MFPPTPTPYPTPGAPPLTMPSFSAWDFAPDAIQTWNTASQVTVFFQAIIILVVVMFIARMLLKMFQYISQER